MKLLKKSLACLLSVMLLLSCIPLSAAAYTGNANTFTTSVSGNDITVKVQDINATGGDDLKEVLDLALARAKTSSGISTLTLANIVSLTIENDAELTQADLDYIWDSSATPETELSGLKVLDLSKAVLPSPIISVSQFDASSSTVAPTLEEIYLPKMVTYISDSAFAGQTELTTFNFSDLTGLTYIGDYAFDGAKFDTLDLHGTALTYIGEYAFQATPTAAGVTPVYNGITSVDLSGLKSPSLELNEGAFEGNTNLTEVNVTGSTNTNFVINITSGITGTVFDSTLTGNPVKIVIEYAKYTANKVSGTTTGYNSAEWTTETTNQAEFVHISAPRNLTATGTDDNQITFTWDPPSYVDPALGAVSYEIALTPTASSPGGSTATRTVNVSDLTSTTPYTYIFTDDLNLINYSVYSVEMKAAAVLTGLAGTTTKSPAVKPDHDDYLDEVMVVPAEAETVEITKDLTNKDHPYTASTTVPTGTDTPEALPGIEITIPANIELADGLAAGTYTNPIEVGDVDYDDTDFGELTYQWYYDTSENFDITTATALTGYDVTAPTKVAYKGTVSGSGTVSIPGITPDMTKLAPGVYYFYVVLTNENPRAYDTTAQEVITVSTWELVRIRDDASAEFPVINDYSPDATYVLNETSEPLWVDASSPDGGTLDYFWHYLNNRIKNPVTTTNTADPYIYTTTTWGGPATDKYGVFQYYVEVENDAPLKSTPEYALVGPITITVAPEFPTISTDPADQSYDIGETTTAMSVTAEALTDGGTLSYQWYQCEDADGTNPVAVGTDSNSYTPDAVITDAAGTFYYYVVVTNTNSDGTRTEQSSTTSAVARVVVDGTDAETPVLGTAVYGDVVITGTTATLEAPAVSGVTTGTISYQWYSCDADGSNAAPISGENGATYDPDTSVAGTYYYYVEVTNTDTTATGLQTVSVNSEVYTLTVVDPQADAETPVIDTDPADAEYETGETPDDLYIDVVAFTSPTVSLSYEWFSCDADGSNANLVGTGATYTPDTSAAGEYYYYVVITNTDSTATVNKTASATSGIAKITVTDPVPGVDAEEPVITTEPESAKYDVDDANVEALTVEANVTDGGTLSYQWYTCDADGTNSAPITGANSASYTPDVSAEGTTYYYVVVTNTNTSATGSQTAETKSEIVSVEVEDGYVAPVEYTVTFMDGEDELTDLAATVEEGTTVAKPADPEKEGYTFTGWYTDEDLTEAYDFDEPVTADLVLYAGWEAESTNHKPYVAGYDDGTFRPNASITRAEAAQMFYNILGYPDVDDVDGDYDGYPDVNDSGWYGAAVQVLSKMEVIKGDTDGNFRPNDSISRAEFSSMVQLFYELADGDATKMPFTDVGSTHWARTAIAAVYEANIVVGTNDAGTLFEPNEDITRAQAVSMLNKAQGRFTNEEMWDGVEIPFSDVTTAHWGWTQIMEAAVEHEHPAATETETDAEE